MNHFIAACPDILGFVKYLNLYKQLCKTSKISGHCEKLCYPTDISPFLKTHGDSLLAIIG